MGFNNLGFLTLRCHQTWLPGTCPKLATEAYFGGDHRSGADFPEGEETMVYLVENPSTNGWFRGTLIFGNPQKFPSRFSSSKSFPKPPSFDGNGGHREAEALLVPGHLSTPDSRQVSQTLHPCPSGWLFDKKGIPKKRSQKCQAKSAETLTIIKVNSMVSISPSNPLKCFLRFSAKPIASTYNESTVPRTQTPCKWPVIFRFFLVCKHLTPFNHLKLWDLHSTESVGISNPPIIWRVRSSERSSTSPWSPFMDDFRASPAELHGGSFRAASTFTRRSRNLSLNW